MVQRWDLAKLGSCGNSDLQRNIKELLFDGFLFLDSSSRFFIPILFLYEGALRRSSSPEWYIFVQYTLKALAGEFTSVDFEHFVVYLYALKQHLFLRMKIRRPEVKEFFCGAYFGDDATANQMMDLGTVEVSLNYYHHPSIARLDSVLLRRGGAELRTNLTENNTAWAIHVGHRDAHQDGFLLMNNANLLVLFEMKFTEFTECACFRRRQRTQKSG